MTVKCKTLSNFIPFYMNLESSLRRLTLLWLKDYIYVINWAHEHLHPCNLSPSVLEKLQRQKSNMKNVLNILRNLNLGTMYQSPQLFLTEFKEVVSGSKYIQMCGQQPGLIKKKKVPQNKYRNFKNTSWSRVSTLMYRSECMTRGQSTSFTAARSI